MKSFLYLLTVFIFIGAQVIQGQEISMEDVTILKQSLHSLDSNQKMTAINKWCQLYDFSEEGQSKAVQLAEDIFQTGSPDAKKHALIFLDQKEPVERIKPKVMGILVKTEPKSREEISLIRYACSMLEKYPLTRVDIDKILSLSEQYCHLEDNGDLQRRIVISLLRSPGSKLSYDLFMDYFVKYPKASSGFDFFSVKLRKYKNAPENRDAIEGLIIQMESPSSENWAEDNFQTNIELITSGLHKLILKDNCLTNIALAKRTVIRLEKILQMNKEKTVREKICESLAELGFLNSDLAENVKPILNSQSQVWKNSSNTDLTNLIESYLLKMATYSQ